MNMRYTVAKGRRTVAAVALAAAATLALAGCISSGQQKKDEDSSRSASASKRHDGDRKDSPQPEPTETLAEVKGESNVVIAVTEAVRDSGGFVTIQGTITNQGDSSFNGAARWKGSEQELNASGNSVAGAYLVDEAGRKRYYVLRDTEGRCLCTTGLTSIEPKETRPFFAQFPAPPEKVTKVEFQLPTMPPAQIELSK